jgi:predicted ATPase
MFESIKIGSFRSIQAASIENLGLLTVLAGKNGAGKTNVLKCIQWAASTASGDGQRDSPLTEVGPRVGTVCLVQGLRFTYYVETVVVAPKGSPGELAFEMGYVKLVETLSATDAGGMLHQLIRRDGDDFLLGFDTAAKIGPAAPAVNAALSLFPEHPLAQMIFAFSDFMRRVKYYPMEERSNPTSAPFISGLDYEAWREGRHEPRDLDEELGFKLLHLYLWKKDRFDELSELIGEKGLRLISNLQLQILPVNLPQANGVLGKPTSYYVFNYATFSAVGVDQRFSFSALSFGTRRVIRLLVAIFYDAASVYMIEQPEDGIHPGLLGVVFPLIRSYSDPAQFFIATHSPEILNRSHPREIRLVDMAQGKTLVYPLSAEQVRQANAYISDEGPLTDFLKSLLER